MPSGKNDLGKEWARIKGQLLDYSQQALAMAHKGEEQLVKFSRQGILHLDATALRLRKEELCHRIGQEYMRAKCPAVPTPKLKRLIDEFNKMETERKALAKKLKATKGR
jgi:hypothetical protein